MTMEIQSRTRPPLIINKPAYRRAKLRQHLSNIGRVLNAEAETIWVSMMMEVLGVLGAGIIVLEIGFLLTLFLLQVL